MAVKKLLEESNKLIGKGNIKLAEDIQQIAARLQKAIDRAKGSNTEFTTIASYAAKKGFGKEFLDCFEATDSFYGFIGCGPARIFKVIKTIPNWMLKVGDYIYFDLSHDLGMEHMEVFTKSADGLRIIARTVIDVKDNIGSILPIKASKAIGRTLHQWIVQ